MNEPTYPPTPEPTHYHLTVTGEAGIYRTVLDARDVAAALAGWTASGARPVAVRPASPAEVEQHVGMP